MESKCDILICAKCIVLVSHFWALKKKEFQITSSLPFNCCTGNGGCLHHLLTGSLTFSPAENRCIQLMNLIKPKWDLALGCSPSLFSSKWWPSRESLPSSLDMLSLSGHRTLGKAAAYPVFSFKYFVEININEDQSINPMGHPLDLVSYPLVLGKFSLCSCEFLNCFDVLTVDV